VPELPLRIPRSGSPGGGALMRRPATDAWRLTYEGFDPPSEGVREVLCAVGNGYLVSRAAAPEASADGVHYPGTYLAGCYDRTASAVGDTAVENEDLVNCPNWLPLTFRPADGEWFTGPPKTQSLELDLRRGVLTRHALVVDAQGRRTRLVQRRIASQAQPHLVALETELVPENWSGRMQVRSALDGTVANRGVARYRGLTGRHLEPVGQGVDQDGVLWLEVATSGSAQRLALAARTRAHRAGAPVPVTRAEEIRDGWAAQILALEAAEGIPVTVEKTVAVYTSRDPAVEAPLRAARLLVVQAAGFDRMLHEHGVRWAELWRRCRIEADFDGAGTLHLNLFHLLQTYSEHSADLDVGVPARGLHGEAYRGHAEMLLEIARFWSALAAYDPARDRYSIRGVVGPDEYHDGYPWAELPGLDDNAYTNVLASWVLSRALDALDALPEYRRDELTERLELGRGELDRWQDVARRLHVPFHDGVLSQFEGYDRLEELDWDLYRRRYPDLRRLDRILEAEGDTVNRYKASKQADALMLFYLFSSHEMRDLLRRLGYPAGHELLRRTVDYYLRRTVHGSTLSALVHAWVLTRTDRQASWRFFRDALAADRQDLQGGTTAEGIHLGAMAGTVDLLQRCYTGLEIREDALWLDPRLPYALGRLELDLRYRGHWGLTIALERRTVTVSLRESRQKPVQVRVRDTATTVRPGESRSFSL